MKRREFVSVTAGLIATPAIARAAWGARRSEPEVPPPHVARPAQGPTLGPEVFARRIEKLQAELKTRKLDLFIAEPSTNFQYFTGYNPGRSERLILLMIPLAGKPALICPSFEVERIKRNTAIEDVRGWEEDQNPWKLVNKAGQEMKPPRRNGSAAVEHSTSYQSFLHIEDELGSWKFTNAATVTERLRIVKSPEEIALIRQAIGVTEAAIAATFSQLAVGMSERDVATLLSREMVARGAPGGGLVQFGPSSALPHGGPSAGRLTRETVVLIDAGSRVQGYTSDITRTIWFGDAPSDEFRKVYNLVHDAQTAALETARPLTTQCQELDRAARKVITDAGYGQYFTHRLGHGMGMDGHEVPYLVEGNETRLEPGMVFSNEPGIYQLEKFGVRIEDDCAMTDNGIEVLSTRPPKL